MGPRGLEPRTGLAAALRRQDLVGLVLLQGAPDPRRGPRPVPRRRPADQGRRLGGMAADRRRNSEQLHGGVQGDLVQAGRLPAQRVLRRAGSTVRAGGRREDVPPHQLRRRAGGWAHRAGRRLDRAHGGYGSSRRQCRCPRLGSGSHRHGTGGQRSPLWAQASATWSSGSAPGPSRASAGWWWTESCPGCSDSRRGNQ